MTFQLGLGELGPPFLWGSMRARVNYERGGRYRGKTGAHKTLFSISFLRNSKTAGVICYDLPLLISSHTDRPLMAIDGHICSEEKMTGFDFFL